MSVHGVGCFDGVRARGNPIYGHWSRALERCYSKVSLSRRPCYGSVYFEKDWMQYSNFEAWAKPIYNKDFNLDKDLMGFSEYSPRGSVFLPQEVNKLFIDRGSIHTPLGTSYKKKSKGMLNERTSPWTLDFVDFGGTRIRGNYITQKECHKRWKELNSIKLREVAFSFKDVIEDRVYSRLLYLADYLENYEGFVCSMRLFCEEIQ